MAIDLHERNWQNLCDHHMYDWCGIWTRYTPQKTVIESFQSLRSFQVNDKQTEIYQVNRFKYANGGEREKAWHLHKSSDNLADGIHHSDNPSMRALFFDNGAAAWVTKILQDNSIFAIEFILKHEHLRISVYVIYDECGSLTKTVSIREDANGLPSQHWSNNVDVLPDRNFSGNWQGSSISMTPDLETSLATQTQLQFLTPNSETFFFPDGISHSKQRNLLFPRWHFFKLPQSS
jgi:Domain of unknown function (DUF3598)